MGVDFTDMRLAVMGPLQWAAFTQWLSTRGTLARELAPLPWRPTPGAPPVYHIARVPRLVRPAVDWRAPGAVRALRMAVGMTPTRFAEELDLTRRAIDRWEDIYDATAPSPDSQNRLDYYYHRLPPDVKSDFAALLMREATRESA